ncbi:cytochrome P450 [Trametes versicolor FP-101664 SS1]|uniref:Cytochrome P450 n=1 Tax=Trametes versicolor (strain FP-101664) TaxID=717944 RepID=R7S8S2_TRAVS|nr:cytochrome P450 [Trametes versicolor FP-101664 SS1]EIW52057.1 cytochrome P450 [Trametes versicolor FP-101664 SS1]
MPWLTNVALSSVLALLPAIVWAVFWRSTTTSTFPGPRPIPLIGNILPAQRVEKVLSALGEKYGPIYALKFFRTPVLVLNSASVARDLLELRSSKYANRPLPKIVEMSSFNRGIVMEHDPARLRLGRKVIHAIGQSRGIEEYRARIQHYLATYLKRMHDNPRTFMQHARSLVASTTLEMSHGYEIQGEDDPLLSDARTLVENFSHASDAGGYLVNWIPFLSIFPEWLPGMQFKTRAYEWGRQYNMVSQKAYDWVKREMVKGTARPSMVAKALDETTRDAIPEDVIMYSAVQVYTGGADTTSSTICGFILMMVRHPDVGRKAQAEIDHVIGRDRLPTYADRDKLPYTNAILSEVLRVIPPISATLREPSEDDVYDGRYIAKETMIIENIWGMLRDRDVYPDPDKFDPERWVDFDGRHVHHPLNIVFGFGRRSCPGRVFAEEMAFTVVALILSLYDISNDCDASGKPIIPAMEQTTGSIMFPLPFTCKITPRDLRASEHVEKFYATYYQAPGSVNAV